MNATGTVLLTAALTMGLVHTLIGPDHYVPFIMMARAGRWSIVKTMVVTFLCGIGHVLSSVVIGLVGVAAGIAVGRMEGIEGTRGEIAAWLLIGFGLVYALWGFRRARHGKTHLHSHVHDHDAHAHEHHHEGGHVHVHGGERPSMTPWVLFTIFVFGPCEPLIPLLMYPAAQQHWSLLAAVTIVFSVTTIGTMMAVVLAVSLGLRQIPLGFMERYVHAIAGLVIFASGLAIQFLGL